MEIRRYNIPKLPRNKYLYTLGSGGTNYSGTVSYVYNNTSNIDIYDGLDSFSVKKALSANLGMVLKGLIDEHNVVTDDLYSVTDNLLEQITSNLEYMNDNFLSKKEEDTAEKLIHFLEGINVLGISTLEDITLIGNLLSTDYVKDSNGFGIYMDEEGKYHFDIDFLKVRGKFTTEELEVNESTYVGGKIYSTKAGIICSAVEEYDNYYRCYFKTTDAEGRVINNQFAVDDLAFMLTFNIEQLIDGKIGNRRFWRLVVAVGSNYIDLSKTDCETDSDIPIVGDSIVLLGNRSATSRLGALILEPLSLKLYKGINSYKLPTPFINLNPEESVIKAKFINEATGEDINDSINNLNIKINEISGLSDKSFTIWMDAYTPTLTNLPASDWNTDTLKNEHLLDIFYNTSSTIGEGGRAYRFELNNGVYGWIEITDKDTIAALEQAKAAEDLADKKKRVFVSLPTASDSYDVGDMWVRANYNDGTTIYKNDELVCITAKAVNVPFNISHWLPTSTATTAYLENLGDQITLAVTNSDNGIAEAKKLANQGIEDAASAVSKAQQGINDAASALGKANSAYNLANTANNTANSNTTVINLTKEDITALANKISFDSSGNVTNISKSGLVTTANFNTLLSDKVSFDSNGKVTNISTSGLVTTSNFSSMFAQLTTADGLVKKADISTFITEDEAGEIVSNATIQADKINFIGKTMINGNFVVDTSGNVTMNNMTAKNGVFDGVLEVDTIYYKLSDSESLTNNCFVFQLGEYTLPVIKSGMATEIRVFVFNPSRSVTTLTFTASGSDVIMLLSNISNAMFNEASTVGLDPNIFYRFIGANYNGKGVWIIEKNSDLVAVQ